MAKALQPELLAEMILSRARGRRAGLLLDYDGTLADITAKPDAAFLPAETRTELVALASLSSVRVGIVTGRALGGLQAVSGAMPGVALAVNGGMQIVTETGAGREVWTNPEADLRRDLIRRAATRLSAAVARWPGALVEDKELSLTVHYRQNPSAHTTLQAVAQQFLAETQRAVRIVPGKESFEIQPDIAWDKGAAVGVLLDRWQTGEASLFLGDDRIDEPAFEEMLRRGGIACRVGPAEEETCAEWVLPTPADARRFITILAGNLR